MLHRGLARLSPRGHSKPRGCMRLLFISTETRPIVGGIANCLDGWLGGLAELGHDVCMLSILPEGTIPSQEKLSPRRYREEWLSLPKRRENTADRFLPLRKVRSGIFLIRQNHLVLRRFDRVVKTFQPDRVIFCVMNRLCCQALPQAKHYGFSCVGIAYGSEIHPARVQNAKWLKKTLSRFDRLIAISEYTRRQLVQWGASAESVSVVHPAVLPRVKNDTASNEIPFGKKLADTTNEPAHLRLLTICRLVERKGVQTVIEALAQLQYEFPHLRYDVIGEGPYRRELEGLAQRLDVMDRVYFHGMVSDSERDARLRACDIFVMVPFENVDGDVEGFGIVYLEAGLQGKPVIGSRSAGVLDSVVDRQTGILINPNNLQDTIVAIRDLACQPSYQRQLGAAGYKWAQGHLPQSCGELLIRAMQERV